MPTISVVVPVYKVEKYLKRCVDSILNQTYRDFELILVDDGSPDKAPEICDDYATKYDFIHVIHQKNGGLSAARNSGIEWAFENSDSQWITFIDSDDWVHPKYLELLLYANNTYSTNIAFSKLNYIRHYEAPSALDDNILIQAVRAEDVYYDESYDATAACARLFKKSLFKEIRFPVGKWHEDTFTTYKLYFSEKTVAVVNQELYFYFQNSDGIVHSSWNPRKMDLFEAEENQLKYFKETNNDEMYQIVLKSYLKSLTYNMSVIKNKDEFRNYYIQLRNKLRAAIKKNKREYALSYHNNFNIFKYAFPIKAKVYRRLIR